MPRKTKTIELTVRVRVPANWSPAHTKREIQNGNGAWIGQIYALGPAKRESYQLRDEVVLRPRWTGARLVEEG